MRFRVNADGKVVERSVVGSSGFALLDEAGLALLQRAEPLPAFPAEMGREAFTVTVPVVFQLQ